MNFCRRGGAYLRGLAAPVPPLHLAMYALPRLQKLTMLNTIGERGPLYHMGKCQKLLAIPHLGDRSKCDKKFASDTVNRDEVDFEFLGNVSGQPYILQTNVFWNGTGGREQRNYLWFDPTTAYHNYSILWNPQQIIIYVDGIPIRVVKNNEDIGIPYVNTQAMKIYASIWDGSIWATRGGAEKINWGKSPFVASLGKYKFDACQQGKPGCPKKKWWNTIPYQTFSSDQQTQLAWANQYKVYDYCEDPERYPDTPLECSRNNF